jgi:hypothetical protein
MRCFTTPFIDMIPFDADGDLDIFESSALIEDIAPLGYCMSGK